MESKTPWTPARGVIRSIIPLSEENHLFEIQMDDTAILQQCLPGQFVQVWVPGVGEAPISVCSGRPGDRLELCVRKAGRVTSALFDMQEQDWLGLRGPFGHGFPLAELSGRNLIMIAGGLGVAPIRSLWQYVLDHRQQFGKLILVYGMRHSIDLLFRAEFKVLFRRKDIEVYIAAEDVIGPDLPPISFQLGRVTDMIDSANIDGDFVAAVCGPPVMYQYVVQSLARKGLSERNIFLSLERHMKCGMGKCGHCYVGDTFTCQKGPVFRLSDLRFEPNVMEAAGQCHA